jgi:hypothetical protein
VSERVDLQCGRFSISILSIGPDNLASILPGLANFPMNPVAELTPSAWLPGTDRQNPEIALGNQIFSISAIVIG